MYIHVCVYLLTTVTWASDNKFRILKNFKDWVRDTTFHPVPKSSVVVNVEEEVSTTDHIAAECPACCRVLEESHVLDQIDSVNWRRVDSFNIKETVVCVCVCVRAHTCVCACVRARVCMHVYIFYRTDVSSSLRRA